MTMTTAITANNNNRSLFFAAAALALFCSCLLDLVVCPHSKVEESFALQATHDLYYHGVIRPIITTSPSTITGDDAPLQLPPYDHLQYPGVVPRTFVGPLILAYTCRLLLWPFSAIHPMVVQFLARFLLMVFNVVGWIRLAQAANQKVWGQVGSWLLLVTACQFHIPFYASRMLPNTFALGMVLQCYACWIRGNINRAAALLVFATAVFRCDLLLLLGCMGLSWLLRKQLTIAGALKIGVFTGIAALLLTVPLDSLLWRRLLWPEGEVFYFNTILGKSKEWGTSPWYWYFASAIPKSMLLTIFLVPLGLTRILEHIVSWEYYQRGQQSTAAKAKNSDTTTIRTRGLIDMTWVPFFVPVFGFVILYSFLGHKEVRFVFPAIPILNLCAAAGMSKLTRLAFPPRDKKDGGAPKKPLRHSWIAFVGFVVGLLCMVLTLCGSLIFVTVSTWNYPGGDALLQLTSHIQRATVSNQRASVNVKIDVATAMSGVSLFGQRAAQHETPNIQWTFSKDGYEEGNSQSARQEGLESFTHLLSEEPKEFDSFHVVAVIPGKPRLSLRDRNIVTEKAIYILEKNDWTDDLQANNE